MVVVKLKKLSDGYGEYKGKKYLFILGYTHFYDKIRRMKENQEFKIIAHEKVVNNVKFHVTEVSE